MKPRTKSLLALSAFLVSGGIMSVKLFGTTVSGKFNSANSGVSSQVTFGDGGGARQAYYSRPAAASPEPLQLFKTDAPTQGAVSTFAADVDTGSYTLARRAITSGSRPRQSEVRPEEFINYFPYDYPAPMATSTARVRIEAAPSPFDDDPNKVLVSIGMQARKQVQPVPVHLTFLVDTSGSMAGSDRLPLAQESIRTAVRTLKPTDRVAIVTYAGSSQVVLGSTPVAQADEIFKAVDDMSAAGGTAMGTGMQLAYDIAVKHVGADKVSRVVVMSDGDANIGRRGAAGILADVESGVADGVTLSTIGYGNGNYNDAMMEQLADAGNGNYAYIDGPDEVPLVFSERLDSMLHVVAKDVKFQVEFDTDTVSAWRQIGYENRQLATEDFRDDRVDAGEVGAGHQVTALYLVTLRPDASRHDVIATARFRYKKPGAWMADEAATTITMKQVSPRIGLTSADFRFQSAVAAFALGLKGESSVETSWIEAVARSAAVGRPERKQFVRLVRTSTEIARNEFAPSRIVQF